jgi:hypothetical protein
MDAFLFRLPGDCRRWFKALEQRSTYSATQSDHYTHCFDIPPQYGTCWPAPNTEHFAKAINGKDGSSWHLPLEPLTATSLEPRSNVEEDGLVCHDRLLWCRGSRMLFCATNIVARTHPPRFSLRISSIWCYKIVIADSAVQGPGCRKIDQQSRSSDKVCSEGHGEPWKALLRPAGRPVRAAQHGL